LLGFDKVFDTDFAADLTIMEETTELIDRITKNENLPILTSCCPGWVKFLEHQFPELLYMPSTAKSPQQMFGAIAKSYYAEKMNLKPEDITVVSIMPCLSKKYEASREEFAPDGIRDVDNVISTRELASMFKEAGIQLDKLEPQEYDNPLGESLFSVLQAECLKRLCVPLLNGSVKRNSRKLTSPRYAALKALKKLLFRLLGLTSKWRFVQA
jgi:iron only hydrogenase large subunit-like protein